MKFENLVHIQKTYRGTGNKKLAEFKIFELHTQSEYSS